MSDGAGEVDLSKRQRLYQTLLVVLVTFLSVGSYFGYQWHIVRERAQTLKWFESRGGDIEYSDRPGKLLGGSPIIHYERPELPWARRMLGDDFDPDLAILPAGGLDPADIARFKQCFPETSIQPALEDLRLQLN